MREKYPTSHELLTVSGLANDIAQAKDNARVYHWTQPHQHDNESNTSGGQVNRGTSDGDINDFMLGDGEVMVCA